MEKEYEIHLQELIEELGTAKAQKIRDGIMKIPILNELNQLAINGTLDSLGESIVHLVMSRPGNFFAGRKKLYLSSLFLIQHLDRMPFLDLSTSDLSLIQSSVIRNIQSIS